MKRARVVLKGAKTYTLGNRRWIKDVPGIVKGDEAVKAYKQNGYFRVTILESKSKKKKPKRLNKESSSGSSPSKDEADSGEPVLRQ